MARWQDSLIVDGDDDDAMTTSPEILNNWEMRVRRGGGEKMLYLDEGVPEVVRHTSTLAGQVHYCHAIYTTNVTLTGGRCAI